MYFMAVKLFIALAIISTFVQVEAKPKLQFDSAFGSCTQVCHGGPHDKCRSCGTSCPLTCESPDIAFCTMQCVINVCQCDTGYVRGPNNQCITREECPK